MTKAVWVDSGFVSPLVREVSRQETERILGEIGVSLAWRQDRPDTVSLAGELRVVPIASAGLGADTGRGLLGASNPAGPGAPTVWVYYWNVAAVAGLDRDRLASSTPLEQRSVGVALGRVIAHEVVHLLAPDLPHTRLGLMSSSLREPFAGPSGIDTASREVVRRRMGKGQTRDEPGPGVPGQP